MVIGAFLAWATVSLGSTSLSTAGTDGDGVITLVLGLAVAAGAIALLAKIGPQRPPSAIAVVGSVIIVIITVIDVADVESVAGGGGLVDVSVGVGLWLTLVGGIAAALGSIRAIMSVRHSAGAGAKPGADSGLQVCSGCGQSTGLASSVCPNCGAVLGPASG